MMATPYRKEAKRASELKRRAAKANVFCEEIDTQEIFARDKWTCQLCGKKVLRRVKWPHDFFPSIDHIIPLSKGGEHSRKNVQCAHLICNLKKSNRPLGQLRMFP